MRHEGLPSRTTEDSRMIRFLVSLIGGISREVVELGGIRGIFVLLPFFATWAGLSIGLDDTGKILLGIVWLVGIVSLLSLAVDHNARYRDQTGSISLPSQLLAPEVPEGLTEEQFKEQLLSHSGTAADFVLYRLLSGDTPDDVAVTLINRGVLPEAAARDVREGLKTLPFNRVSLGTGAPSGKCDICLKTISGNPGKLTKVLWKGYESERRISTSVSEVNYKVEPALYYLCRGCRRKLQRPIAAFFLWGVLLAGVSIFVYSMVTGMVPGSIQELVEHHWLVATSGFSLGLIICHFLLRYKGFPMDKGWEVHRPGRMSMPFSSWQGGKNLGCLTFGVVFASVAITGSLLYIHFTRPSYDKDSSAARRGYLPASSHLAAGVTLYKSSGREVGKIKRCLPERRCIVTTEDGTISVAVYPQGDSSYADGDAYWVDPDDPALPKNRKRKKK
jgi:hypothetical protein